MTPEQSMMARAGLHWSRLDLAAAADLGVATVVRFESGQPVQPDTITDIRAALEKAGVEFIDGGAISKKGGPGVRLQKE